MSALVVIIAELWNVAVLAGTAYLVGWQGWSPWWFVLAVLLLNNLEFKRERK